VYEELSFNELGKNMKNWKSKETFFYLSEMLPQKFCYSPKNHLYSPIQENNPKIYVKEKLST